MEENDFTYLKSKMNQEGFHYCFMHYSSFEDIEDPEFHKLRLAYIEAAKQLNHYINEQADNEFYGE